MLVSCAQSFPSIIGATENLLTTEFTAEPGFSAGLVGILVTLVYFCLPAFLLVVECSLLPFGKPEHSCSKNHGHYHRSQAQGWIDGLRHADPHHAKGCDSLSGKPDVRTELFPHLLIVQPLTTQSGSQLYSTS